ncbi:MAG TPA: tetratricopeptide repeat protein [Thermoanaerobaculia bacterium]
MLLLLLAATSSSAACERSVMYILRGQYDAALQQLEGARSGGASPADVDNLRGLAELGQGDAKKALASFDRALMANANHPEAKFNRAVALLRLAQDAKAAEALEPIAKSDSPLRGDAAYHLGLALDRLGRPADAETWLERAMTYDSKLDAALLLIGRLRERRRDHQGAGRAYFDYLKKHPESTAAMLRFGISAHRAGRIDVARSYLNKVIAADPRSYEATEARKYLVMWE